MKTKITYRWVICLGLLYILLATFMYYCLLDADGQDYISITTTFFIEIFIFVYLLKKIVKGAREVFLEEESHYAVAYLFSKIGKVTIFQILYSVLQGFICYTDYSIVYGLTIFIPSLIIFVWSYSEIDSINNMRNYWKVIVIAITFFKS